MVTTHSRWLAVFALVLCASLPRSSFAQQMSFSYYTDWGLSSDLNTLFTVVNGSDHSSGCYHYAYDTTAQLQAPGGTHNQSVGGMQAFFSVPASSAGSYRVTSELTVSCSCFGSGLSAGGVDEGGIALRASSYYNVGIENGRCLWRSEGFFCPGPCSASHTTNTFSGVCYTNNRRYKICGDILKNGKCWFYRPVCVGSTVPGWCGDIDG